MEKISFYPCKKKGEVRVKYRIRDGRSAQVYYTTDILCSEKDLEKLNPDGSRKDRVKLYNTNLADSLKKEYDVMVAAYAKMRDEGLDLTTEVLEREIVALKNPVVETRTENPNIVTRFRKYADGSLRSGIIGEARHKHIIVVSDKLERFLIINGISGLTAEEFDIDHLMAFREFLFDEYLYVKKYERLYKGVKAQNKPQARLSMNTVTSQMKMFQTFFTELEDIDEIRKSPFRKLGKERKKAVMRTKYDDPFFLRKDELQKIISTEIPQSLQDTRDAFVVQCAFGCRISDFLDLSLDSIAVSEDGIPYIHYIPKKTADAQEGNVEVQTPIVRYAFDIIKKTGFEFPILRNIYGTYGYNARIRSLLQHCKIDRQVAQYNEETKKNDYLPLYKVGSSKLARKTHVDIMNKVQVDMYAAGLHKVGSSAVSRYTSLEIKDRFKLMNVAFEQNAYKVDNQLTIIE